MPNQLLNLLAAQPLSRLGLPRQNSILGHSFIKDMIALSLAESNEENEVIWSFWNCDNAVKTPGSDLGCERSAKCKDIVNFFPRIVVILRETQLTLVIQFAL